MNEHIDIPPHLYGVRIACQACGSEVEAERPTFVDSPNPLWRCTDASASAQCPATGSWHQVTSDPGALLLAKIASYPKLAVVTGRRGGKSWRAVVAFPIDPATVRVRYCCPVGKTHSTEAAAMRCGRRQMATGAVPA